MAETFKPPQAVRNAARRGLDLRAEQSPSRRGGTSVGVARARNLANGDGIPLATIGRMVSFFARHSVNRGKTGWKPGEVGYPSKALQAWLLWGGDAGKRWADGVWERNRDKADVSKLWTGVL